MIRAIPVLTIAFVIASGRPATCTAAPAENVIRVSGTGVDNLNTALVHSKVVSATGLTQKSTEIVELSGDLNGRVLYHVTTVIDFATNMLTNTGDQVYSGTIAGSDPVMIHDDQFRFTVNLSNGEESGDVYLIDRIAGPKVRCTLHIIGTGLNAVGNPTFSYSGECAFRGDLRASEERQVR